MYSKKNIIYTLGAYDRFNYGDLLFPIITKNFISQIKLDIPVFVYALMASDFSKYGALKTRPIKELFNKNLINKGDIILYTGGGTIGSSWIDMHIDFMGKNGKLMIYYFQRLFGEKWANNISRYYFKANSAFPWISSPDDFPVNVKVVYNAVGGSEFSNLKKETQLIILNNLSKATYLSVRDKQTKLLLSSLEPKVPVHLSPDSAILMSEQYPLSILKEKISEQVNSIVNKGGDYICFQSNMGYARKNKNVIIQELEKIYHKYGLRVVFLPIGRYYGLSDHKALMEFKDAIHTDVSIASNDISIWEVMYIIAKSALFLGTSLHGNITAQSFAVPHIGLSGRRCKVDYYLETWDIPEQSQCIPIDQVSSKIGKVLSVDVTIRQKKREELIALASTNYNNLLESIKSS